MNKIYKVVWSKAKHTYVVASEIAKGHTKGETTGKGLKKLAAALLVAAALLSPNFAWAADTVTVNDTDGTSQTVYTKTGADEQFAAKSDFQTTTTQVNTNSNSINTLTTQVATLETADKNSVTGVTGSDATLTVTKGDGTTSEVTIDNVNHATSADSAATAESATKDGNGNEISTTYATKEENQATANNSITDITGSDATLTVTKGDGTTSEVTIDNVNHATSADSATTAESATKDGNGNEISTTYATKEENQATANNSITDIAGSDATLTVTKGDGTTSEVTIDNVDHATSADSATKATQDGNGNEISTTYATKTELSNEVSTLQEADSALSSRTSALEDKTGSLTRVAAAHSTSINESMTLKGNQYSATLQVNGSGAQIGVVNNSVAGLANDGGTAYTEYRARTGAILSTATNNISSTSSNGQVIDTAGDTAGEYSQVATAKSTGTTFTYSDGTTSSTTTIKGDSVSTGSVSATSVSATEGITDGTTTDGKYVQSSNTVGLNLNALDQGLQDEEKARADADTAEAKARADADTAEKEARIGADTTLVAAVNSGLSLSDDNVLQKNATAIDENGNVTTSKTAATEMILNKGEDNQITMNDKGIKVGTNSSVMDANGVYTGGDTYDAAKAAMSADGSIKGANGDFTVDKDGNVTSKATITGETVTDGKGASMSNGTVTGKTLTDGIATITNGNINTSGTITGGTVTSTGNISALGDIHADGAITGASASIQGALTAGSATITGDLTAGGAIQGKSISDGTATMQNGNLTGVKNLSAETITTSGDATIGGDLTVNGKLNVDEIDLTKNGIDGDYNVTSSTKVAAGEITSYKKATSAKDGSEKESSIDYDENGTSTWAKSTDADGNWSKSTLTVKGDDVTSKVVDSTGNKNESTQTASESNSVVSGTADGKTYRSYITQNLKQILQKIEDGEGNILTSTEQTETDITNTAKNGTITNDADKVLNQGTTSVTSQIGDGSAVKSELTASGITNTAVGGTITNSAKDLVNTATGDMTNTVGGKLLNDVTGDMENKVGGNQTTTVTGDSSLSAKNITNTASETLSNSAKNISNTATEKLSNSAAEIENTASTSITDKVGENTSWKMTDGTISESIVSGTASNKENTTVDGTKRIITSADGTGTYNQTASSNKISLKNVAGDTSFTKSESLDGEKTSVTNTKGSSTINQSADSIVNFVKDSDGNTTRTEQSATDITNTAKKGTITNDAKDVLNKGSNSVINEVGSNQVAVNTESVKAAYGSDVATTWDANGITNTAATIKDVAGKTTVTTTDDGTTFENTDHNTAIGEGTVTKTTISGNTLKTGQATMDYAEVMKDLGVRGNAVVDGNTSVGGNLSVTGTSTLAGDVTMGSNATVKKNLTVEGETSLKNTSVDGTLDVTGKSTLKGGLDVTGGTTTDTLKVTGSSEFGGAATFNDIVKMNKGLSVTGGVTADTVTANSYKVGDKTYIDENGINANNQVIRNVGQGNISEGSTDAVSGGQLYETNTRVSGLETRMGTVETRVDKLDNKIDKVGANAAAMANLHPLEFDEDSKWNVAAAVGTSGSETASAVGVFYRPNENVMVNASAAMGTGENMFGGGVSLRLGHGGNKAKEAQMKAAAKENRELRAKVDDLTARMDALLSVLNPNMSKDFPDVPENHWAYEAVSRLAGNGIVEGYEDGKYHGERQMTRYEMAEIIYNALSKGAKAEKKLVEEFRPELQAMAAQKRA